MRELSLNILDIATNCIRANAKNVEIAIAIHDGYIHLTIADDGCGMTKEFLKDVEDPFTTTRTTRKVGLGIPLMKQMALDSAGTFAIDSTVGIGTTVKATFEVNNVDRAPLGALEDTLVTLISDGGQTEFKFSYYLGDKGFEFSTGELRDELGVDDLNDTELLVIIRDFIKENISIINGGELI